MLFDSYPCDETEVKIDPNQLSYEIPGQDGARISILAPPGKLLYCQYEDGQTMLEIIQRGCRISNNGRCVGWRSSKTEYSWLTYKEFLDRAKNFGSGLANLGIKLGQSSGICIYGLNCIEWLVAQYACIYFSSPVVPLYDTLGTESRAFMINMVEAEVVVCDNQKRVNALLLKSDDTPTLKYIIHMKGIEDEIKDLGKKKGINLYLFSDIEDLGKASPVQIKPPKPTDTALICFTSGTTGDPKGVVLSHRNITAAVDGAFYPLGEDIANKNDVYYSFLPLAHIFDQIVEVYMFKYGASVGYYSGDLNLLTDDMRILKPSVFAAVPRVFNKIQEQIDFKVKSMTGSSKVHDDESKTYKSYVEEIDAIYTPEIRKLVNEGLGGNIRQIICAAAPVSDRVLHFYRLVFNCQMLEFYGQTECAGPATSSRVTHDTIGTGVTPIMCTMLKIIDVPDLGYYKKDGIGEICFKGPNVFSGYYKNPEKTAEAIQDGWLHSGDIGKWMPNGNIKIVDRKKHIFKLSQGEYIVPERIEAIYTVSPYISQILVHGDSLQSYLVAIVIPDQNEVTSWCKERSIAGTWNELCRNPIVKQLIMDDMQRIGEANELVYFQKVEDIYLHPDQLSIENGQLTPTQKTKRDIVQKMFLKNIQDMYNKCK